MADELTLADRLRTAIDETERLAQAADFGPWEVGPTFGGQDNRVYVRREGDPIDTIGTCVIAGQVSNMPRFRANARHIARHDPAAVLRRCAADRKILDAYEHADRVAGSGISPEGNYANGLEFAVREIAEAYGVEA